MTKKLVFIHGRAQQNKKPDALKQEWIATWEEGLGYNKLDLPIPETDIRFPYYGDTLFQLAQGLDPALAAQIVVKGDVALGAAEKAFMEAVLKEVAEKAGITEEEIEEEITAEVVEKGPLNWEWVQGILKVIDGKVPFGSSAPIALFTRDVYLYLTNAALREHINNGVRAAINADEPTVVVSHSLGTVVAYWLVREEAKARNWQIPTFVTVGSPLGIKKIRQSLSPISALHGVGKWLNAYDEGDVVALFPLKAPHFDLSPFTIENKNDVQNKTDNQHGIAGYLNDPVVAKWIYDAVSS